MRDPNANNKRDEISVQFSYDMPDAYLYQTTNEGKVGQWTYEGPRELWVFLRKRDNKRTGEVKFWYEVEDDFVPAANEYMVKVNCEENPLLCELMETDQDTLFLEGRAIKSETLPMNDYQGNPFVHYEPEVPTPDHTYDRDEITYDPVAQQWNTPFPFLKPHTDWEAIKKVRWSQLSAADGHVSPDMPASVKQEWIDFRQKLRDIPQTYGAAWTVTITDGGSGYSVNDVLVVPAEQLGFKSSDVGALDDLSAPMGKRPGFDFEADPSALTSVVDEIDNLNVNIIVTSVDTNGAITGVRTRNAFNARHIKEAKTIVSPTVEYTGDGSAATFTLSKVVRVDPWKVRFPQSPKAKYPGIWGESDQFPGPFGRYGAAVGSLADGSGTDAAQWADPSDGWLMEHTYHPATLHFIPPEKGGNYFASDLARLGLSTDGTPFDDGIADGLPAAPIDVHGNTRIAGVIKARKQTS
jgi:hypothetical protein